MLLNRPIPYWYILNKVKIEIVYVLIIAFCIFPITRYFKDTIPEMPLTVPTFIGTAISIILSFKLSQSYDRWWEARKIWGSIVNDSRSLVIQLQTLLEKDNDAVVKRMAYRQIAWCYSLGQTLRGKNATDNIKDLLSEEELKYIEQHSNKPLAIMQQHGKDLKMLNKTNQLELFGHIQIDSTLVRLVQSMGMAERIKNTVFPVTYRLFLHFIIYIFVVTLSIALVNVEIYFEIPLLLVISTSFFLLERSATHMQDPFDNKPTDTAMTSIARTIEINLKQLINDKDIPQPLTTDKFYLS